MSHSSASGSAGSPAQSARQKFSARPCELVHSSAFSSPSSLEKAQPASPAQKQDQDKYTALPASATPEVHIRIIIISVLLFLFLPAPPSPPFISYLTNILGPDVAYLSYAWNLINLAFNLKQSQLGSRRRICLHRLSPASEPCPDRNQASLSTR